MEGEEPERGRHQKFTSPVLDETLRTVFFEIISGTHSRHDEEQCHKPGIGNILESIQYLPILKWTDHTEGLHTVEDIYNMIYYNNADCNESDVIKVCPTKRISGRFIKFLIHIVHIFPTFALNFNIFYQIIINSATKRF